MADTLDDLVKKVEQAHCDVNGFYVIISIIEGRAIGSDHADAQNKIVEICKAEAGKAVRRLDRYKAAISKGWVQ